MDQPPTGSESPRYYILVEDSSTQTTERDFYILEKTRDASTQTTEEENGSIEFFSSEQNYYDVTSETSGEKKRKISKEEDSESFKRSKSENYKMGDQVFSKFSDDACKTSDARTIEVVNPSWIASGSGIVARIPSDSNHRNQETKTLYYFSKEKNFPIAQCLTYNENIFQKENASGDLMYSEFVNIAKVGLGESFRPVAGTSRCLESNSQYQLCSEIAKNVFKIKQPQKQKRQIQARCLKCKQTVPKLLKEEDKYRCCMCYFSHKKFCYLQIHVYNEHVIPFYCNVCQMKYSDKDSHVLDQTCDVCHQLFACKYQLEEHYFSNHESLNKERCRICKEDFRKHFIQEIHIFKCCFRECKYQCKMEHHFAQHLYKHFPLKIYTCEVCGNHFKQLCSKENHSRENHFSCEICEKKLLNIYFLYQHLREEHEQEELSGSFYDLI